MKLLLDESLTHKLSDTLVDSRHDVPSAPSAILFTNSRLRAWRLSLPQETSLVSYPVPMLTIRRARPADAEALVELSTITFTQAFGHLYDPADLGTFLTEAYDLQKHKTLLADPDHAAWLVEDDGALVGYALAGPCDLPHSDVLPEDRELKRLYLLADYQQSGLGSTLIELALEWIGPRTAWLGVWSQNFGAQRFYHRYGFSKAGEYFFKVGNHRDHEFIYRRPAPLG